MSLPLIRFKPKDAREKMANAHHNNLWAVVEFFPNGRVLIHCLCHGSRDRDIRNIDENQITEEMSQ